VSTGQDSKNIRPGKDTVPRATLTVTEKFTAKFARRNPQETKKRRSCLGKPPEESTQTQYSTQFSQTAIFIKQLQKSVEKFKNLR
jgi:hypothetical protein